MSDTIHPPAATPEPPGPAAGHLPPGESRGPASMPGAERVTEAIMFTDIEKSVDLQQRLGTEHYAAVLTRHGELFYEALGTLKPGYVEKHTGDGFMVRFGLASDAVAAALRFQWLLRREQWNIPDRIRVRIGIHQGEILLLQTVKKMPGTIGTPVNLAARVMSMAEGGQILLTRAVFDSARQFIREIPDVPASASVVLGWEAHGNYVVRGMENPVEIFEVGERGRALFTRPKSTDTAQRVVSSDDEATLGWRPARGMEVPKRAGWFLQRQIGEGGFGEAWVAENHRTRETRVFKFCFDSVRLRSFKRELALFRLISEALGPRRDIATLYEVQLESAPFFLESEFCPGGTLKDWLDRKKADGGGPLATRLGIVARVARALAAAHSVGVIHKDVKPTNIFIEERSDGDVRPRLADFGIGTIADAAVMANLDVSFSGDLTVAGDPSRTGTRLYSAPEYMVGRPASILGDIYSLGVLLYQMVIGDFDQPLGPGWQRHVPDALLADDIAGCVDVDPQRRFSSALQLAERLENLEQRRAAQRASELAERQKEEQLRELALHRRRVRVAWTSAVAASLLLGALSVILFIEYRRHQETLRHADALEKEREIARSRLYVADMQSATDDLVQRRAENTRELIQRHVPKPGESDHRGWEWFLADSILNTSHLERAVSPQPLRGLAVNADQTLAAVAGDDGNVSLWTCDTLENKRTWRAGAAPVQAIAWNTAGELATGLANGEIATWDAATGHELHRWKAHEGAVTSASWHPATPTLATGGADGRLAWWQPDGKPIHSVQKQGAIQAIDWHPGTHELAAIFGRPAHLIIGSMDTIGAARETPLEVNDSPLAWRPHSTEVALAKKNSPMRSFIPSANDDSFHLRESYSAGSSAFAWSPRGNAVAVGGVDGKILMLDATRLIESRIALYSHNRRVTAMRWLGGKRERLLSVGEDGFLRAWDNLGHSPEVSVQTLDTRVADARWQPHGERIAILLAGDEVQILDSTTLRPVWSRPLPLPRDPRARLEIARLAWSSDGTQLAAACPGRPLTAWDLASGMVKTFAGIDDATDVQWMNDDRRLLLRTPAGWAWLAAGGTERQRIPGTEGAVWVAPLEADRIGLVKPADGGLVFLATDLAGTGGTAIPLPPGLAPLRCAALSADRTHLALAGESGMVLWLDTRTGECHRPALGHAGPIHALAWHPDGSRLVTAGADGTCRLFNIAQVAQNWVIKHNLGSILSAVGWSADGSRLLLASESTKMLKIYDASASLISHGFLPAREPASQQRETAILTAIAQQPGENFGWRDFSEALKMGGLGETESATALWEAAARLGAQFRFDPLDDEAPADAALQQTWRGITLPPAVQIAEACALRRWDAVLDLCKNLDGTGPAAEWTALAKAEALAQTGHLADSEANNLVAWKAMRRRQGGTDSLPALPVKTANDSATADLRNWANIRLEDDWNDSRDNNLSSLPAELPQREGFSFHNADFIQLAGLGLRISKSRMLPRSTGWIPLHRPATSVSFLLGACYIDIDGPLQDTCVGSLYLLRRGAARAVRIPLLYGRNVWDWWTPPFGGVEPAPAAAIAWTGENPKAQADGHNLALYKITWTDVSGEPPVVAISFVSHLRRPAPFLVSAEVRTPAGH